MSSESKPKPGGRRTVPRTSGSRSPRRSKDGTVEHPSGLTIRNADLSRSMPFRWAWDQRVLLGYLNLLIGQEGIGKGNLAAWIAARITRGDLPGDLNGKPGRVAFIGDEDSWDHIWVPRLAAAGANEDLAEYIAAGPVGTLNVRKDADELRDYIRSERVALVYFDQLLDNLGVADSWKDKEVRDALAPLRSVASDTDAAMLAAMHPNKRGGSFRDRISGTPAFNALSRSSLLVAAHPEEAGRVVVVRGKGNYSVEPPAFEFEIIERALKAGGRTITTSQIGHTRESGLRAADLLGDAPSGRADASKAATARRLLEAMFADDKTRLAKEVEDELFEHHGIEQRVASEAANAIGLVKWRKGFGREGVWYWGRSKPKPKVVRTKQGHRNARAPRVAE
jgi:hypothetical protein